MIEAQNTKAVLLTPPAAKVDDAAVTTETIDTMGWSYLQIYVLLGDIDADCALLKLQESDASNMDGAADIAGTVVATAKDAFGADSVLPTAAGADDKILRFDVDLRGRKRYIDLLFTAGNGAAGTYIAAMALLSRGQEAPNTAAEAGCHLLMRV